MLFILLAFLCCGATLANSNPVVHIGESKILGKRVQQSGLEVKQFLAIPYAEPPIGSRRFQKPVPISSYPRELKAFDLPPACHQYSPDLIPWYDSLPGKSEDCLYLNIWTPTDASPNNTKAVMFWIHGGVFRMGSIRQPLYNGIPIAALGDIVLVTVNYRLGPFGFLTSNTKEAPGNIGLWDVLEGLRWVNKNIRAFGGDPSKITMSGESAGSMFSGMLSVSPLSKGLYSRQIMESGSPTFFLFGNSTKSVMNSQYAASRFGCSNDSYTINDHPKEVIQCLQGVDADALAKLDSQINTASPVHFSPQYGDEIVPTNPRLAFAEGKFHGTDLLIGANKNEGSQLSTFAKAYFGVYGEKVPHLNKTAAKPLFETFLELFPEPKTFVNYYLNDSVPENDYEFVQSRLFDGFGEQLITCPAVYHAEKTAEQGHKVYFYFWVHRPSNTVWNARLGVAHFSEVEFVFGGPVLYPKQYKPDEVKISTQIIEMWSSFVKYGKPSIPWPKYSRSFPIFKYLGPGTETQNHGLGPQKQECDFMRNYFGF